MLSELAFPHIRCCLSVIPSDLMKPTAVDESLSSMNQQLLFQRKSTSTIATTEWEIYINLLQSSIESQLLVYIHFTLLAYAHEQICLPHHPCMSTLYYYYSLHVYPKLQHILQKETTDCNSTCHTITIYVPAAICPKCPIYQFYDV